MTIERQRQLAFSAARDKAVAARVSIVYWVDNEVNLEYIVDPDGIVITRSLYEQTTSR